MLNDRHVYSSDFWSMYCCFPNMFGRFLLTCFPINMFGRLPTRADRATGSCRAAASPVRWDKSRKEQVRCKELLGRMRIKLTNFNFNNQASLQGNKRESGSWEDCDVQLKRGREGGFGFAVTWGEEEEGKTEVRVEDVVVGGAAEGRLKVGDLITSVEGKLVGQLPYEEAIQVNTQLQSFWTCTLRTNSLKHTHERMSEYIFFQANFTRTNVQIYSYRKIDVQIHICGQHIWIFKYIGHTLVRIKCFNAVSPAGWSLPLALCEEEEESAIVETQENSDIPRLTPPRE